MIASIKFVVVVTAILFNGQGGFETQGLFSQYAYDDLKECVLKAEALDAQFKATLKSDPKVYGVSANCTVVEPLEGR